LKRPSGVYSNGIAGQKTWKSLSGGRIDLLKGTSQPSKSRHTRLAPRGGDTNMIIRGYNHYGP